jgi:hypothetical protein
MSDKDHDAKNDGREFTRVHVQLSVKVSTNQGTVVSDRTLDVSMKGLFIHADKQFPVGTPCDIVLILGTEPPLEVQVRGKVQRCIPDGMGLEITEIPLDSYSHLQNIVMYNSQDSHQVEKEIRDHLGIKRPT